MDAEQAVIGSYLAAPRTIGALCRERRLEPSHFYHPPHQAIYQELQGLDQDGVPVCYLSLCERLKQSGALSTIGGTINQRTLAGEGYLIDLSTFVATAANAGYYIGIVKERYGRREAIRIGEDCAAWFGDDDRDHTGGYLEFSQRLGELLEEATEEDRGRLAIREFLDARRFDLRNPPPEPPAVLKLGEHVIATPENFVMVQAKVKAGKTAALGAIIAATMEPAGDCLGFASSNPQGLAVIHFDTEQSRYHHHLVLSRALGRAGRREQPAWLRSYYMKGSTLAQLMASLHEELERGKAECGGVFLAVLDGIGDYCADVNDPEMAFNLVAEIERLAVKYQTVFVLVLHENPGSLDGKTRGHLGSHLERKAETNLRLEKDAEGVTVIYSERSRTAHIPKDKGPRFAWSDEAKMHVTVESTAVSKTSAKVEELRLIAEEVFKDTPANVGLGWLEVVDGISRVTGVKPNGGGRKKLVAMMRAGVIAKRGLRYFRA
ncbi:MAG TPA: DnaB-like helicase N-terminal domain-containing protein [Chthoniobacter sp.]|jgi:hypothetical protein